MLCEVLLLSSWGKNRTATACAQRPRDRPMRRSPFRLVSVAKGKIARENRCFLAVFYFGFGCGRAVCCGTRSDGPSAGSRPSAPRDQRTASTYIFGAVRPNQGKCAGLILPACNTEALRDNWLKPRLQILRRPRRAAKPGTSSPISPGGSCPSDCDRGPMASDRGELVLATDGRAMAVEAGAAGAAWSVARV
jgi:hypothetical protein